jgi:hypothetical protein
MDKRMFHRAPAHHTITCSCCGDRVRVPARRRFLCDDCFLAGPGRKGELYSATFDRKLTEWLVYKGLSGPDNLRFGKTGSPDPLPLDAGESGSLQPGW